MLQAVGQDLSPARQQAWQDWVEQYKEVLRANGQSDEQRIQLQNRSNPCYIPRNHLLQTCIEKAEEGDFSEVNEIRRKHKCHYKTCASRICTWYGSLMQQLRKVLWRYNHLWLAAKQHEAFHAYPFSESETQQLMSFYSHQLVMLLRQLPLDCELIG